MNSWDLQGKTAVVCGASQGIGEATAKLLAERGARVVALARNEDKLKELVKSFQGSGHKYFVIDLADTEALKKILPELAQENVQILVNNSGGPKGGPLLEASVDEFESPLKAHLKAAHLLVQTLVPSMKKSGYGRIVNIISTSVKNPIPGLGVSNTVRGAMASWSKTLAGELGGFGITVNNMLPGYIRTGRIESLMGAAAQKSGNSVEEVEEQWIKTIPAGRIGDPQEAAEGITFLVSPAASYINGINLPVDGGRTPSL
ncbi:SDR family oxidoreductase [Bdellovibrio sp. SKB1291214]|uniref:SDR family oxidoreductase n=1 Tax=Bdellovibrio sp. SKB1291214 TaxID=1732569 RepID=UPI000B51BF11|nr:SDR family oxidoreductase [Bdellovibrio sp. SKB1291214]UYL07553.1 SDR family oxidoreductase [Bdellovibrio sp. SKB1291214]